MSDAGTPKARIVAAALRLAAERPWSEVTLIDIAATAGLTLKDLRTEFASKGEILSAFGRMIDDEVLARATRRPEGQSTRDTLFEVLMSRFDALAPYRKALASIYASGAADPAFLRSFLSSQTWMLNAAGVSTDGIEGGIRVAGLASVYASVFQTWLEDDDPGLARTMAALDRRLRRGERTMETVDGVAAAFRRMAEVMRPAPGRRPAAAATPGDAPPDGHVTTH